MTIYWYTYSMDEIAIFELKKYIEHLCSLYGSVNVYRELNAYLSIPRHFDDYVENRDLNYDSTKL